MSDTCNAPGGKLTAVGEPEQLAEDLYTVEASLTIMRGVVFPLRMTVIRLPQSTDLVVYSPLDPSVVDLSALGTVKAVIAPNAMHSLYAQSFASAHAHATLYSSPGLPARFPDRDWGTVLSAGGAADAVSPHTPLKVVSGFSVLQEVLLLHRASGTLVAADMAFNLTPGARAKMSRAARWYVLATRATRPLDWGLTVKLLARADCGDALPQLRHVVEEWQWDRFVPAHGDVVRENAKQVFRDGVYRYVQDVARSERPAWRAGALVALVAVMAAAAWKYWCRA